jgi:hypothetical protein
LKRTHFEGIDEDLAPVLRWIEGRCFEGWEVVETRSEQCRLGEFVIRGVDFLVMLPESQVNIVCKL